VEASRLPSPTMVRIVRHRDGNHHDLDGFASAGSEWRIGALYLLGVGA
jgi:hypothetical protein